MLQDKEFDTKAASRLYYGPSAQKNWLAEGRRQSVDVVLLTHPRDRADIVRMFPWADSLDDGELRDLLDCLQPIYGEIIEAKNLNVGILFLPILAEDMIDPRKRGRSRNRMEKEGLAKVAAMGAKHVCLGGLTGALSNYGRRIESRSKELGLELTTGHAVTSVSIAKQYDKALRESGRSGADTVVAILGVGSVGAGVAKLFAHSTRITRPARIILVDTLQQQERLQAIAEEIVAHSGVPVSIETLATRSTLPADSLCYRDATAIISAVSTPYILDIDLVAPGTILIDDSQPYCWDRDAAWKRVQTQGDILPCDAGLVDVSEIEYRSFFPFDFADDVGEGSSISWSCLAEGLLRASAPYLASNVGEADAPQLLAYEQAFDDMKFDIPPLQCGKNLLPVARFRACWSAESRNETI
ncbi:putative amino acid dehydrogenase [Paraburkholderia bryophila]|uniref:Putative amino acid dehydrogenase n=1 Tax=Paraburkholderia bryophila TaxID=420952 RepID=A0A329B5W5_9BURK|nr:putative amino acid dehydrogenase [Paraburkholderia bryophila]